MSYFGWGDYVSVAQKRRRAEREVVAPDESEKDKSKEKVKPPELKQGRPERPAAGK